ncbi:hypothetical protein CTAM01_02606 [Colletotrichum tamarilloi]|uniref:Uncharacterized protein n=1 Tax=Colletotrichum tamarilloi TaxID=1209934 RepID=A0ABQ9RMH2_9PEZI|nr:uncharacterized protein CTAM01_02606 [Colletotrichum tamarilloi]KAI3536399.1 hypothetical protein CSPX01_10848 [Colletotrichum filicis]KAK1507494.1 hypothetical protein CTAM01_02606 [Colletotrichum tamarilloi]
MPSARGYIKGVAGGSKFTSTFLIDDVQYHFSGTISPAVPDFTSNEATLEYESLGSLTSNRDFDGTVGTQSITLEVANGTKLTGQFDRPISPASSVSGTGTWSQN